MSSALTEGKFFLSHRLPRRARSFWVGRRARHIAPILLYHGVETENQDSISKGYFHNVLPDVFQRQIEFLKQHFDIVSVETLMTRRLNREDTAGQAAITFDDGYRGVVNNAVGILESLKAPATIFVIPSLCAGGVFWRDKIRFVVNTKRAKAFCEYAAARAPSIAGIASENLYSESKRVGGLNSWAIEELLDEYLDAEIPCWRNEFGQNRLYADWSSLQGLEGCGIRVGNHSQNHYIMSNLSRDEQYEEITSARRDIERNGHECSNVFSLPFGGLSHFNDDTLSALRMADYKAMLLSMNRTNHRGNMVELLDDIAMMYRVMAQNDLRDFEKQLIVCD